jgi:hypothetical protein
MAVTPETRHPQQEKGVGLDKILGTHADRRMEKGRMQRDEKEGGGKGKKERQAVEGAIGNTGRLTFLFGCLIHVLPTGALLRSSSVIYILSS